MEPRTFSSLPVAPTEPPAAVKPAPRQGRWIRYGAAIAIVVIALLLRIALYGDLNNRLPFAFFLPAAMIAAWYGGLGPGLLAAAAGLLLGDYFFLPPHHALGPLGEVERTSIVVYALTATLAVILIESLHGRIRSLECRLRQRPASGDSALPRQDAEQ